MGSKDVQAEDLTVRRSGDLTPLGSLRDIESTEPTVITGSDKVLGLGAGQGSGNSATESGRFQRVGSTGPAVPAEPMGHGSPAEVARVLLGHQLDHFQLESLIGGGGMGAVFRARDTRLDRTVAIKVIPRVGDDPELLRRFRNEAQSAARLDHPNIARVYDVGRFEGWHYIVFEYIEGTNVRDLVEQQGLLSVDDAVFYTRQVAEALEHAHRRGVTHRDIKPSNVLITTSGQVKLVDMGLARAQQLEMSEDMTASGVTLGTFDYISPEQARDPRDADVRSDIYSLGCTLYFMLTGQPPYPSGTVLQKLLSHGASPPPDPRVLRTGLSDNLVAILHKMLAKQPDSRYRRPVDLISDLYLLAEREHLPRTLSIGSIAIVPANRFGHLLEKHLPWMVAVACLLISVAWLQLLSLASNDLTLTESVPLPRSLPSRESSELGASTNNNLPDRNQAEPPRAEPFRPLPDNAATNGATSVAPEQAGTAQPTTSTPPPRPTAADSKAGDKQVNLEGVPPASSPNAGSPVSGASGEVSENSEREGTSAASPVAPSNSLPSGGALPMEQTPGNPAAMDADTRLDGSESTFRGSRRAETVVIPSTTGDGQSGGQPADSQPSNLLTRLTDALAVSSDKLVDVRRRNETGSSAEALPNEGVQGNAGGGVAVPAPPTVIRIVGAQDSGAGTIDANNRLLVTTLGDALAAAAVDPNIQVIEIGPGKQQSGPVTIPRRGLTLRGAAAKSDGVGLATQLEFVTNDPASMERPAMIRLGNHSLDIDQLHLVWRCPAAAVDGGSLFQVQGGNTLRLNRSLVTIENELARPNVHVVESELKLADEANPPLVAVKLTDCIVRGDLTLLASDQAGLIEVLWDNGLLVAGKGMIETGGAANRAGAMAARVRLIMNDVTAVLEGPLVAQRLVSGANQPIPIDREANRCVFSFPANSAMLEVSGLPELAALERIVSMRGRDNYYDSSRGKTQFYVIGSSLDRANLRFSVADLMSGSLPKWAGESSPQAVVYWTKIPPSPLNSHLRTPGDFLQEGVVLPGFVGERLPFVQLLEGGGLGEGI